MPKQISQAAGSATSVISVLEVELKTKIENLSSSIETASTRSAESKEDVNQSQSELPMMVEAKADLEQRFAGVHIASASVVQQPAMPRLLLQAAGPATSIRGIVQVFGSVSATFLATEETERACACVHVRGESVESADILQLRASHFDAIFDSFHVDSADFDNDRLNVSNLVN